MNLMTTPKKFTVQYGYAEVEVVEVTAVERLQLENDTLLKTLRKTQAEVEELKAEVAKAKYDRYFWSEQYYALVNSIDSADK